MGGPRCLESGLVGQFGPGERRWGLSRCPWEGRIPARVDEDPCRLGSGRCCGTASSGSYPANSSSGGERAGVRTGAAVGEAEVLENPADDLAVGEESDELALAPAPGAGQDVDLEGTSFILRLPQRN